MLLSMLQSMYLRLEKSIQQECRSTSAITTQHRKSEGIKNNCNVTGDVKIANMPFSERTDPRMLYLLAVHASVHAHVHGRGYEVTWTTGTSRRTATTTSKIANQATLNSSIGFQ